MFKKFIDELIVLDECSGKTVEYLTALKEEDFTSLLMRVDIIHTWLNGIRVLRADLGHVKGGDVQ